LERFLLLQHAAIDNNLIDDVPELLYSMLLEHVFHLLHAAMDDHFVDDVSELLHSMLL
jgi:hypothetical protein